MTRRVSPEAKVFRRSHEPAAKYILPQPVHRHSRRQRIALVHDPPRQRQPVLGCVFRERWQDRRYAEIDDPTRATELAAAISQPPTQYAADLEAAADMAVALAKPGDVVITIGAGDVTKLGPMIVERLS